MNEGSNVSEVSNGGMGGRIITRGKKKYENMGNWVGTK